MESSIIAIADTFDAITSDRPYRDRLTKEFGKIGVDDSILNKPGKLTDVEFKSIHKHPLIGYEILSNVEFLGKLLLGII